MSSRPFDFIIYGATGFAGKHVVKHFLYNHPEIKIAIAGRNHTKLTQLASELSTSTSKIEPTQILVASSTNKEELVTILSQATICLACAGPYRHVGRNIVEAAIDAQTNYLDLCGEPQFFDDMLTSFDAKARQQNVIVMSACAFDCVPSEICYHYASNELKKKYTTTDVTNVEIVHTFQNINKANATTFHAAVDGFHASYTGELKSSRENVKKSFPQLKSILAQSKQRPENWKKLIAFPSLTTPLYHSPTDSYLLKFVGADASCVLASDRYVRLRHDEQQSTSSLPPSPYLSVSLSIPQKSTAYSFLAYGAVFSTLARWPWGVNLLHSKPELFTNGTFTSVPPTQDELKDATFTTYGTAYGLTKEECVRVKFSGGEPGYIATSAMMAALALTVLNHRDSLAYASGVMLPGAALKDCTEVYDLLRQEGLQIEVVPVVEEEETKPPNENELV